VDLALTLILLAVVGKNWIQCDTAVTVLLQIVRVGSYCKNWRSYRLNNVLWS